ncbi:YihY/virulence factor BrkB family protein, partial [Streptomyces sp. SID14478]|nr:YihY/virulence factor BrkB family protein [Streptomyces sp. SID14478]
AANERVRHAAAAQYVARAAARTARHSGDPDDAEDGDDTDDPDMPSEFPERWSKFLPPEDVTSRLRTHVRKGGDPAPPEEQEE